MKHHLYDELHNLMSLHSRKALFQHLANKIDGDQSLTFALASAMSKKVLETSNALGGKNRFGG
jgi:hypothetical protein